LGRDLLITSLPTELCSIIRSLVVIRSHFIPPDDSDRQRKRRTRHHDSLSILQRYLNSFSPRDYPQLYSEVLKLFVDTSLKTPHDSLFFKIMKAFEHSLNPTVNSSQNTVLTRILQRHSYRCMNIWDIMCMSEWVRKDAAKSHDHFADFRIAKYLVASCVHHCDDSRFAQISANPRSLYFLYSSVKPQRLPSGPFHLPGIDRLM